MSKIDFSEHGSIPKGEVSHSSNVTFCISASRSLFSSKTEDSILSSKPSFSSSFGASRICHRSRVCGVGDFKEPASMMINLRFRLRVMRTNACPIP